MVAAEPMLLATANPIRNGMGLSLASSRAMDSTGVKAKQTMSLASIEDNTALATMMFSKKILGRDSIGSIFKARILEETRVGPHPAVIPEVPGTAHIMGLQQLFIDPDDPLKNGFLLSG